MKKCPFCAEEVQGDAIKCKHCGSDLLKSAKEHLGKFKWLAIASIVLGVLSVFFASIGIIPFISLIVSILALFKIKRMNKSYKIITVVGFILALTYSTVFLFNFSKIGSNALSFSHEKTFNKELPRIVSMSMLWSKQDTYGGNITWEYDNNVDKNWANQQWGCFEKCNLVFNDSNKTQMLSINLSNNDCNNSAILQPDTKKIIYNTNSFCAQIICDNDARSDIECWSKKK